VVGRLRDLLTPPWRAVPAIFYACTRAAFHPVNDTVLRTVCGPDNLSKTTTTDSIYALNWNLWWGGRGSNPRPTDYESAALTS
jgi:hypothetical protein